MTKAAPNNRPSAIDVQPRQADCAELGSQRLTDQHKFPVTKILQLSHTASRVVDMAATRAFYEEFLELPMITSMLADFDAGTGQASDYIHCFFRMADGSCIAFFQFGEGYRGDVLPPQGDAYDRHLALRVGEAGIVDAFHKKAQELGIFSQIVDHDDFYSLYLVDPDQNFVEVTWHKPSLDELANMAVADETLNAWLTKQKLAKAATSEAVAISA